LANETSETQQNPTDERGPVLVAVDFAPDSEAALLWACDYADCVDAAIVVLHVIHEPADAPGYYRKDEADLLRPMDDVAVEMLDQFIEKVTGIHPGLEVLARAEKVLVKGIPATRILEIAEAKGARLIVMGSRGRTGLPHLMLGSKAERVVQMSPIPVTIVKADQNDD